MRKPRKNCAPVGKVPILRPHLIDRGAVSDLCDEHQLLPTLFDLLQKPFFEGARQPSSARTDLVRASTSARSQPSATSSSARTKSSPN